MNRKTVSEKHAGKCSDSDKELTRRKEHRYDHLELYLIFRQRQRTDKKTRTHI